MNDINRSKEDLISELIHLRERNRELEQNIEWLETSCDVTELKRIDEESRESEQLYRTLFENMEDGFVLVQPIFDEFGQSDDYLMIKVNHAWEKQTGLKVSDLIGKRIRECLPKVESVWPRTFASVIKSGKSAHFESFNHDSNRWYDLYAFKYKEDQVGVLFRDITERKKTEEALHKSEKKYRDLFESISDGFCIFEVIYDDHGRPVDIHWLEANPAYEKQSGLKDIVGKLASDVIPGTEIHWLENYDRVIKTGKATTIENWHEPTDRWYCVFASLINGAQSRQVVTVFQDITERKRHEMNTAILDEIGKDLSVLSDPDDTMQAVGERLGKFLQASACIFAYVDEAKNEATIYHGWNTTDVPSLKQTFRLADYFGEEFARAGRAGETVIVHNTARDERPNAEAYAKLKLGAFVTVPFQREGRWTANITVTSREPRDWRTDEIGLVQEIASRVFPRIERARSEEAVRTSEEKFRTLSDTVPALIWHNNATGENHFVNKHFLNFVGMTAEEIRGEGWQDIVHPDEAETYIADYMLAVKEQRPWNSRNRIRRHDGEWRWFHNYAQPLFDSGGVFLGHVGVSTDITNTVCDEEARRENEARQTFLLKLSDALRAEPNAEAVANRAIRMLSEQLRLDRCYIGVYRLADDRGDFTHQVGNDRVPPLPGAVRLSDFPEALRIAFDRTLVINDVEETESLTDMDRRKLGTLSLRALVAATLRKGENNPLWSIVAVSADPRRWTQDETALVEEATERTWAAMERARAEEALCESEEKARLLVAELEKADRNKNQFISVLSHELRNPLASILMSINLLEKAPPGGKQAAKAMEIAKRQGKQLANLVDDLLDVTRITQNKVVLKKETVELNELINKAVQDYQALFIDKNIRLEVQLTTPLYIKADASRIIQVIGNLLHNAAKFTRDNDLVSVTVSHDFNSNEAVIIVQDTGRGIEPTILENLFEPFMQVDKTLDRTQGGLGLGLAIVKGIVELHSGRVEVFSGGIGQGAKFIIRLPLSEEYMVESKL